MAFTLLNQRVNKKYLSYDHFNACDLRWHYTLTPYANKHSALEDSSKGENISFISAVLFIEDDELQWKY